MSISIHASKAPQFPLPFSHAIRAGDFLYVSGQVGVNPDTLEVSGTTIEEQTEQCIRNVGVILEAAGVSFDHVVKTNAFLSRAEDIPAYNQAYKKIVAAPYPARTTVVSGIGSYLIEIDVIAYIPSPRSNA